MQKGNHPMKHLLSQNWLSSLCSLDKKMLLLIYVVVLHGTMFFWDILRPGVFLNADRGMERIAKIEELRTIGLNWKDINTFVVTHGLVGDYLPQALLYLVGGRYVVILVQVVLMIAAVMAVYSITHRLTASPKASLVASLLYGSLPHSMVYPHMLASEGLFDSLLVISFYLTALLFLDKPRWSVLVASSVLLGCATLVRPITILWPLVVCVALLASRISVREALLYPLIAFFPLVLWVGYIESNTGILSLGGSSHDPSHNLYDRVTHIINRLPEHDRANARAAFLHETFSRATMRNEHVMTLLNYFRFCQHYPVGCLRFTGEDVVIYFAKSGVEKVTIDYLDLAPDVQELVNRPFDWRDQLNSQGMIGSLKGMLVQHPRLILLSLTSVIFIVLLWTLAEVGVIFAIKGNTYTAQQRTFIAMLGVFPFYVLAISLWTGGLQTRHRAPAEFALCVMAVLGWSELRRRISLQTPQATPFAAIALGATPE
jgi:4-amino-4-deoxy-L-arabinose transferase-like glycosyltransferase